MLPDDYDYDYDSLKKKGIEAASLTQTLEDSRVNRFMEFLIILQDNHYEKGFLGRKSVYEKIMKDKYDGGIPYSYDNGKKCDTISEVLECEVKDVSTMIKFCH